MTRFPFGPLVEAAGNPELSALAREIGFTARTMHRWHTTGAVAGCSADVVAVRLGHHPAEIWPRSGRDWGLERAVRCF